MGHPPRRAGGVPGGVRTAERVRGLLGDWAQTGGGEAFTEAVFLTPPRLMRELDEAPEACGNVLQLAAETCELPQYRDCTEHLHVVVRT